MADPPSRRLPTAGAQVMAADPWISGNTPSIAEGWMAASKLKSGKAAGVYGIAGELIKAGGEAVI